MDPVAARDVSVFVETFNCGEKWITDVDLNHYVPKGKDIYVFSLQECMKANASVNAIRHYLASDENDYQIELQSIGGTVKLLGYHGTITVIVAVKKSVVNRFNPSVPYRVCEGFGFRSFRFGNKGSVAIQLRLANQTLLVIASHFASDLKVGSWEWRHFQGKNYLAKRLANAQNTLLDLSPEWLGLAHWDAQYMATHTVPVAMIIHSRSSRAT